MKSKVPRKSEDRKGFSLHDAKYLRGLAHHAARVIGNFSPDSSRGTDSFSDKTVYANFTSSVSTGRKYLIEFLADALVLRWVKE